MLNRKMRVAGVAVLCAVALGCQKASPTQPTGVDTASASAASVTDARTGVTIVAAKPSSPANAATIPWAQQPITLTVTNAVSSNSAPLTYTFQVASDAGFTKIEASKAGIAAGSNGTTSVALDKLAGARTYYWRAQASASTGPGPYSTTRSFAVGPEVVLGTPVLASPINGAQASAPLALTINNVSRSGPAGPIVYTVEVASTTSFSSILFSAQAAEQSGGQTTVTAAVSGLVNGATYYWRAKADDATNKITTPYSTVASFAVQLFNFATAKMWDNPQDVAVWPETTRITSVEFTGNAMRVDFDRREGSNRWPDQVPPGFAGPLQYTLGMCRFVQNDWHCSAVVEFWYGRSLDDTAPPSRFWREWWYDGARWGPLATNPPQEGDLVGVYVGAGDLRGRSWTRATCPGICERSNIVFVPFTTGYAYYPY
jgi:hypothetical protein